MEEKQKMREEGRAITTVPLYKKKAVEEITDKIKSNKTFLIASTKGLPSSQFHSIKKKLRGRAEVKVAKKSLVLRAISGIKKGTLQNVKDKIGSDVALFFSDVGAFELSSLLTENQSPTRAKAGDIAPEDIKIEPGPTELLPGPAISELSGVGLKVAVENGKLSIKQPHTLVKKGEEINSKVASVLGKLGISPMKVGFIPVAAYSATDDKTYFDIKIDKEGTLSALREAIGKSLNFTVNIKYVNSNNIGYFIAKSGAESKALEKLIESNSGEKTDTAEQNKEEIDTKDKEIESVEGEKEEKPTEEIKEESKEEKKDG